MTKDEIDDKIDEWHDGNSPMPLHEFLGMTKDEYSIFVQYGYKDWFVYKNAKKTESFLFHLMWISVLIFAISLVSIFIICSGIVSLELELILFATLCVNIFVLSIFGFISKRTTARFKNDR